MEPTPITMTSKKLFIKYTGESRLLHNSQLSIIEHDLFFTIMLKPYSCNRVVCGTLNLHHYAETKFLMLDFLTDLQTSCVACLEIGRRNMFLCLLLRI